MLSGAIKVDAGVKNKYFLTDLDGTLLRNDASLSTYTVKVLEHAMSEGAVISFATARSYISAHAAVSQIGWRFPVVLYNGALLFDPVRKEVIKGHFLDGVITNSIIEVGQSLGLTPMLFCFDNQKKECVLHPPLNKNGYLHFINSRKKDPRFRQVDKLLWVDGHRTLCLTYIGLLEELEPLKVCLQQLFQDKIHIHFMKDNYINNHYFLEIAHPKANKKEGLLLWAQSVGCSATEVTVFGDNLNDLGLFSKAGRKVAVSNANASLKALADEVIASNERDGVAHYIARVLSCHDVRGSQKKRA